MKLVINLFFISLLLIVSVGAVNINTFNNSFSSENLTITETQNVTRYLEIQLFSNIKDASINIKNTNFTQYLTFNETADEYGNNSQWTNFFDESDHIKNVNDTDYGTYGTGTGEGYLYSNISKNNEDLFGFVVGYKYYSGYKNVSVPSDCYGYYTDKVSFRFTSFNRGLPTREGSEIHCYNGGWKQIFYFSSSTSLTREQIFEEYYYQNRSGINKLYINSDIYFNQTGDNNSIKTINNTNTLNNILPSCSCEGCHVKEYKCLIPYNFYSQTNGTIEYSGIDIQFQYKLNITFLEEQDNTIVDDTTISVEFVSDTESINTSTDNGNVSVYLNDDYYTIRYYDSDYSIREYVVNLDEINLSQPLYLYMLNQGNDTDVTATVYNELGNIQEGVYIYTQRYDVTTNSYNTISVDVTNFEGVANLNIELYNEKYQFLLYYPYGTLREQTLPAYIYADTIDFQINTGSEVAEDFYNQEDIVCIKSFVNDSTAGTFTFTYNDPNLNSQTYTLSVYDISARNELLVNGSVSNSNSYGGTLSIGFNHEDNKIYHARLVNDNGLVCSLQWNSRETNVFDNSKWGLFLTLFLTMIFVFITKRTLFGIILVPLPLILVAYTGMINIPIAWGIMVEIIALVIAFAVRKI